MQRVSLLTAVDGGEARDCALIQYDHQIESAGPGPHPRVHTVRNHRWRLSIAHGVDWGELYDLEGDPHAFRNLMG